MTRLKAIKFAKATKSQSYKLQSDDIRYIIELSNEHPRWSVNRIFKEALRPKIRTYLMFGLTPKLKTALGKASEEYQISETDIVYYAVEEWLKSKKLLNY